MGRVVSHVSPWNAVTTYSYRGKTVEITAPGGAVTRIENDALGRPVTITDAEGGVTRYTYGPFGGLWTVTDPGGAETRTERDAYGRVRTLVQPDRGTTRFHYDGFGQALGSIDVLEREVEFAYDGLGRRTQRIDRDGKNTFVTRWWWDTAEHGVGKIGKVARPTTRRENRSRITARYSQPSCVQT